MPDTLVAEAPLLVMLSDPTTASDTLITTEFNVPREVLNPVKERFDVGENPVVLLLVPQFVVAELLIVWVIVPAKENAVLATRAVVAARAVFNGFIWCLR